MSKLFLAAVSAFVMAGSAMAAESCDAQASAKNLSGAAKASFTKKCEADAKQASASTCEDQATAKKLAGAAKTSFMKKCVADAKA